MRTPITSIFISPYILPNEIFHTLNKILKSAFNPKYYLSLGFSRQLKLSNFKILNLLKGRNNFPKFYRSYTVYYTVVVLGKFFLYI